MTHRSRDTVTVSPPTFDRMDFARVDATLPAAHAPFDRDWLMARFAEGLQIRMLRPPCEGLVLFQPGRLAWRPVEGADRAVVVHDLRVGAGPLAREGAARLWAAVERFAAYYGYAAVLALTGAGPGLIAPANGPGRGWLTLDRSPFGDRLVGRILQGPLALPRLPQDWAMRAAALGPGVVIQTTGESATLEARARAVTAALAPHGVRVRHDRATCAEETRCCAVRPGAAYAVVLDGRYLGGPELGPEGILRAALGAVGPEAYSPA
ncbi:hypothetical protein [Roseicyclus persicicus]|uniref:GNAT family N-acetyltransferase n=1 Tax=Roseicyclus persicicus TaxID=2650661 RepID=A0A7X6GYJ5_9RHOB|nr:hypothetical protein [Roseibacterium persicicum]NKX43631.1 hypothetical protein [Roseibacterium persicicum]